MHWPKGNQMPLHSAVRTSSMQLVKDAMIFYYMTINDPHHDFILDDLLSE